MNTNESILGEVIYAYTRKQAVADGEQVDVTTTAQEAGIRFPVFITRTAFDAYVTVPLNVSGQNEAGRLWDVVWMLRFAIRKAAQGHSRLPFALYVRNDNRRPKLVKLIATCGALDMEDPRPAITVMLPDED
jgi:isopentenyl diphosphate isomerase/L-lactate dehydrogenase-like FMN-dependent dehydrogenase